jgi:hypothetical protein
MDTTKTSCGEKEIEIHAQSFVNYSTRSCQHNWGEDVHENLITQRIFVLTMHRIFIKALKIMRTVAADTIWIC